MRLATLVLMVSAASFAHSDGDAWVLVRDGDSCSMNGSTRDLEAARSHLREFGPGYLWFRKEGKEYVVRGAGEVKELLDLEEQQHELGAVQGRLGRAQGKLGRQQGKLGRQQARAGLDGESRDGQRELGRAQAALGREQAKMGREQAKMGARQAELGKKMEEMIGRMIELSLKDGSAKRI